MARIYIDRDSGDDERKCSGPDGTIFHCEDSIASEVVRFPGAQNGDTYEVVFDEGVEAIDWGTAVSVNPQSSPPQPEDAETPSRFWVFIRAGQILVDKRLDGAGSGGRYTGSLIEATLGLISPAIQQSIETITPVAGAAELRARSQDRFMMVISENTTITVRGMRDHAKLEVYILGGGQNVQFVATGATIFRSPAGAFTAVTRSLFRLSRLGSQLLIERVDFA